MHIHRKKKHTQYNLNDYFIKINKIIIYIFYSVDDENYILNVKEDEVKVFDQVVRIHEDQ